MLSSKTFPTMADRVFPNDNMYAEHADQEVHDHADENTQSISSQGSEPRDVPQSPGSSVSTRMQEEYDELLKHAIVMPRYSPLPHSGVSDTFHRPADMTGPTNQHEVLDDSHGRPASGFGVSSGISHHVTTGIPLNGISHQRNGDVEEEDHGGRFLSDQPPQSTFLRTALYAQEALDRRYNCKGSGDFEPNYDNDGEASPRDDSPSVTSTSPDQRPITIHAQSTTAQLRTKSDTRPAATLQAPVITSSSRYKVSATSVDVLKQKSSRQPGIRPAGTKVGGVKGGGGTGERGTGTQRWATSFVGKTQMPSKLLATGPSGLLVDESESADEHRSSEICRHGEGGMSQRGGGGVGGRLGEGGGVGDGLDDAGSSYSYSETIDQDVGRMEALMDTWTSDLKKNVLAEFSQAKVRVIERHRQESLMERDRHIGETSRVQNDIEALKELLNTYEQSLERKDQVITNLTATVQRHRDKFEVQRAFYDWKIQYIDNKRAEFASKLAQRHYERSLRQKAWAAWHSIIESRWQQRVEKACQAKAQDVCVALTNDYETKLASLNEALESSRAEVLRLHKQRDEYEETMKKAFMRGVCALNLEAMTMFQEGGGPGSGDGRIARDDQSTSGGSYGMDGGGLGGSGRGGDYDGEVEHSYPVTIQQERVYSSDPPGAPPPRLGPAGKHVDPVKPRASSSGPRIITAKVSGRADSVQFGASVLGPAQQGLAPPMSSVVVERHQPINKQTIGQATASKYPRVLTNAPSVVVQRRSAAGSMGQHGSSGAGAFIGSVPNLQTIKASE